MTNQPAGKNFKIAINWIVSVLLVQLILINISAAFHAYRITHYYDDDRVRNQTGSSGKFFLHTWRLMVGKKFPKSVIQYYPPGPYDTVQMITHNGKKIEGWWMKADTSIGTVILFHGLGSNKGNILAEAYEFLTMGYNTLLIDVRAHGNSSGIASSIGAKESEELKMAFDFIKSKGEKNIVLWGMSMGAVIITRAIYEYGILPQKIILEMPFAKLQDHIKARARVLGFPDEPYGFFVTFWIGVGQGYWGYGHQTKKYAKAITCPVLMQWGARDEYVLKSETETIFKNLSTPDKSLVVYAEGSHQSLLGVNGEKWKKSVSDFLAKP